MSTPQLALRLRSDADQRLETFIAPEEILEPLRRLAAGEPGWIHLAGPPGSGKTHLALGTVQAAMAQGLAAQYVPLPRFQGRAAAGLAGLEQMALVVLDDLDAFLGARADEVALFDFHNRARDAGTALLYLARRSPAELDGILPDLRSRLAQCVQLRLPQADDLLRQRILQRRAQTRGWLLEDAAIGYLLRRVGRDMGALTALLDRLDQASLAAQRRVTVPFIRALLERESGAP